MLDPFATHIRVVVRATARSRVLVLTSTGRRHLPAATLVAMSAHAAPPAPGALRAVVPYLRPERGRLALSVGVGSGEIGCRLLEPWPLALAVDHALSGRPLTGPLRVFAGLGSTGLLVCAGVATVVLSAVGGLLDACSRSLAESAAERMGGAMRAAVFGHVLGLSLRWHDRVRTGEVLSRLSTDVGRVLDALVAVCATLLPNALLLAGALTLLLLVDPALAGLGLVVLPLLAWLTARQRRRVRAAELAARDASGRLSGITTDLLRNVRAVQAFGRLDRATAMYARPNARVVDAQVRAVRTQAWWSPVPDVVLAVGAGTVLVAGGLQVRQGAITIGGLLVVLMYLSDLQSPVRSLVRLISVRAKAAASAVRLCEVLDCTEAVADPPSPRPVPPVCEGLRLESVRFSYSPDRPVLAGLDLSVAAGETVCLFGPSGAGKSTVLHLLLRLYDVDAGRVLIDGVDVRQLSVVELRRQLAFVPQDPWLLDATIAENIAFGSAIATRGLGRRVRVVAAGGVRHPPRGERCAAFGRPAPPRRPGAGRRVVGPGGAVGRAHHLPGRRGGSAGGRGHPLRDPGPHRSAGHARPRARGDRGPHRARLGPVAGNASAAHGTDREPGVRAGRGCAPPRPRRPAHAGRRSFGPVDQRRCEP
jgi:ATP-binding cassette subfamily B protein